MKACFMRCLLKLAILIDLAVLLIVVAFGLYVFADRVPAKLADYLYPSLYPPYDDEAPPTPTTFPASSEIKAVIGGKGEGLSCSVPFERALFRMEDNAAPLSLQFRQACAFHDYCYRHGTATYGYEQVDCDFMLVQHAYRICRMIYRRRDRIPDCWLRAREVLAGVRIGGARDFKPREFSTYFEFDPMPISADNYVIARLVSVPSARDRQKVVSAAGKKSLQRSIFSYLFQRGMVTPRLLTWGDAMVTENPGREPYLFPDQAIATPPHVFGTPSGDILLAAARQGPSSSSVRNVRFPAKLPSATKASKSKDVTNTCGFNGLSDRRINKRIASVKFYHQWAPQLKLISLCDSESDRRVVIQADQVCGPAVPDYPTRGGRDSGVTLPRFFYPEEHHDDYRLLQSEPLTGRFRNPDQEDVLLLSRGLDSKGKQYTKNVKAYLASLYPRIPDETDPKINMLLSEASEPVAPVALADGRTGLLSVIADEKAAKTLLQLRYLADCGPEESCGPAPDLDSKLDHSWAAIPVQVLDSVELPHANLVFFSRLRCRDSASQVVGSCTGSEKSDPPPDEVLIDFAYQRLLTDQDRPLQHLGRGSCRVSLAEQVERGKTTELYKLVTRTADNDGDKKYLAFRDFARRWSMSQVIPGRIFEANPPNDRLDVAVIFNGYPGFSLLFAGTGHAPDGSVAYGLEAVSPSYVHCD